MTHRLFVGLRLPHAIVQQLCAIMGDISGARWQSAEQLHLTLLFLGQCNHHQAEDVAHSLLSLYFPAFSVSLEGLGHFDTSGRIESLWVGVRPQAPVQQLHHKLAACLRPLHLNIATRAYLPHVTLARFNRAAGDISAYVARHAGFSTPAFDVDAFYLFESHLTQHGAHYESIARYPLAR